MPYTGLLAAVFYVAHVVAGRIVWSDYNPFSQPISDLTAATAISRNAAGKMLYGYDLFNLLFCAVLLFFFARKVVINKTFYTGLIIKAGAEVLSTVGYKLFPLADTDWAPGGQNMIHYGITAVIVLGYISLAVLLTVGLARTGRYQKMTGFLAVFSFVFIISGFLTVVAAQKWVEWVGLVERVNLYSLMSLNAVLALWMAGLNRKLNRNGDGVHEQRE